MKKLFFKVSKTTGNLLIIFGLKYILKENQGCTSRNQEKIIEIDFMYNKYTSYIDKQINLTHHFLAKFGKDLAGQGLMH